MKSTDYLFFRYWLFDSTMLWSWTSVWNENHWQHAERSDTPLPTLPVSVLLVPLLPSGNWNTGTTGDSHRLCGAEVSCFQNLSDSCFYNNTGRWNASDKFCIEPKKPRNPTPTLLGKKIQTFYSEHLIFRRFLSHLGQISHNNFVHLAKVNSWLQNLNQTGTASEDDGFTTPSGFYEHTYWQEYSTNSIQMS